MKKASPFGLDRYGSRAKRVEEFNKPDDIYAKKWISVMFVIVFLCIDFFCLKSLWNSVQTENMEFVMCLALACALSLDVPLAIAACSLKKYNQGLCGKKEKNMIMILSIALFAITFVFNFGFRIFTKDLTFSTESSSLVVDTQAAEIAESGTDTITILFAALYCGVIPLLTSICSFLISYWGYDPLGQRKKRLEKGRISLQANIHEAEKALAETSGAKQYCNELITREEDLYQEFMNQLDADALALKQMVRVLIMKKLGTPEYVSAMSKEGAKLAQSYEPDGGPGRKLPGFIEGQMGDSSEKKEVIMPFTNQVA